VAARVTNDEKKNDRDRMPDTPMPSCTKAEIKKTGGGVFFFRSGGGGGGGGIYLAKKKKKKKN
jgi:hypothetical protein